jgi:putative membrane protein
MSLGTDLKRFSRGALPRIALVTVILMPLLYGAMYLWAFWNPFNEVNKIPVALVNEDTGAVVDGKPVRAGAEVADALVDSGQLQLHRVSAAEAAAGVSSGKYYFSVTLPQDFSADIASPSGGSPEQAQIRFTFNDANNYLGSIIGQNAAREVINQVNASIGQRTLGTVLTGLTDAGAGLVKAADGAGQLATGTAAADDGAHKLADGAGALTAGLVTARDGSAQLAAGTRQLAGSVDTATGPLITMLDRVDDLRLDPDEVGFLASRLSGAVRSTTDRIAALNIDQAQAAAIVDQTVGMLQANPDPTVRDAGDVLAGAQRLLRAMRYRIVLRRIGFDRSDRRGEPVAEAGHGYDEIAVGTQCTAQRGHLGLHGVVVHACACGIRGPAALAEPRKRYRPALGFHERAQQFERAGADLDGHAVGGEAGRVRRQPVTVECKDRPRRSW